MIELMHFCLSLGYMGPYPDRPRRQGGTRTPPAKSLRRDPPRTKRRERRVIPALGRHRGSLPAPFAPGFSGVGAGNIGLAAIAALFVWCARELNAESDGLYARMLAAAPARSAAHRARRRASPPPPPPDAREPGAADRRRAALAPELDRGLIAILEHPATEYSIHNKGLFPMEAATLGARSGAAALLDLSAPC